LLNTTVQPENTPSVLKFEAIKLMEEIQTKFLEISKRKADLLAELRKFLNQERIDCEGLVQRLENYFTEMAQAINNLVSEIKKNEQIPQRLGVEAVEELIEDIKNLLYLDPEEDGDLINRLRSLLEISLEEISSKTRAAHFQLALILDGGKKLEQFRRRVQAALNNNNYEELEGLVGEISALEIMQVSPNRLSIVLSEREAYELQAEYRRLIEKAERQLGLST